MNIYKSAAWHVIEGTLPLSMTMHFHLGKVLDKYHKTAKRGSITDQKKSCEDVVARTAKTKETLKRLLEKKDDWIDHDRDPSDQKKVQKMKVTFRFLNNLAESADEQLKLLKSFESFGTDLNKEIDKLKKRVKSCKPGSNDILDIYVRGLNNVHTMLLKKSKVPGIGALQLKQLEDARRKCNATEDTCEKAVKAIAKKPDPAVAKKHLAKMKKTVAVCLDDLNGLFP